MQSRPLNVYFLNSRIQLRTFLNPSLTRRRRIILAKSESNHERTYKEELYVGRRVEVSSGRFGVSNGLSKVYDLMRNEGVVQKIRDGREWVPPGRVRSLEQMKLRQEKFRKMVSERIGEIQEVNKRLKP